MNEIHERNLEYNTYCKDCVFSIWEGNSQIGCKQNRLEKYKKKAKAEEIVEKDKTFYEIKTICNLFRDQDWADRQQIQETQDLIEQARKESEIRITVIILFENEFQDIESTFISLYNQHILPKNIIITSSSDLKFNELSKIATRFSEKIPTLPLKIFDKSLDYLGRIDESVRRVKNQFYLTIKAGEILEDEILLYLNDIFNNLLKPFSLVVGENFHLVQRKLHELVGGNKPAEIEDHLCMNLVEKIKYLSEKQNNKSAIITL